MIGNNASVSREIFDGHRINGADKLCLEQFESFGVVGKQSGQQPFDDEMQRHSVTKISPLIVHSPFLSCWSRQPHDNWAGGARNAAPGSVTA